MIKKEREKVRGVPSELTQSQQTEANRRTPKRGTYPVHWRTPLQNMEKELE